jgi:hypothetical protein
MSDAYVYGFAMVENYKAIYGMCVSEQSPQFSGLAASCMGSWSTTRSGATRSAIEPTASSTATTAR